MSHPYPLRPLLIAIALLGFAWLGLSAPSSRAGITARWEGLERRAERSYRAWLAALLLGFFGLAFAAKLSQLSAGALSAWDFWLFEDMLRQLGRGGFMLTRFAPQSAGWTQHGAVHPMFSWALAVPLSWIMGATHAALAFGPLALTGAGAALAALARPRWGALGALAVTAAFLSSSLVARVLMYEVHPEALYPCAVLAWAWAAGWGDGRLRAPALLGATLVLTGIKEDSFLLVFPLVAVSVAADRAPRPRASLALITGAALLALAVSALQFHAVHQWLSGAWGPREWEGFPVAIPPGAELMKGRNWDGPSSAVAILGAVVAEKGGIAGILESVARFLFSRPLLALLATAPWIPRWPRFWVASAPLLFVYALLPGPASFVNYYSAPLLGLFWLAAATAPLSPRKRPLAAGWILACSLLLGGSSITFHRAVGLARMARSEASMLLRCLEAGGGRGVVTSPFLGDVPRELVLADHELAGQPAEARFYLFSTRLPSYELPQERAEALALRLGRDPGWTRVGHDCRAAPASLEDRPFALLFVKRP